MNTSLILSPTTMFHTPYILMLFVSIIFKALLFDSQKYLLIYYLNILINMYMKLYSHIITIYEIILII